MPDQPITMSMFQLAGGVFGLALVGAGILWRVIRYLEGRREEQGKDLHARISSVREECVRREDWHEDRRRMEERMGALTAAINNAVDKITGRIDALFGARSHGSD